MLGNSYSSCVAINLLGSTRECFFRPGRVKFGTLLVNKQIDSVIYKCLKKTKSKNLEGSHVNLARTVTDIAKYRLIFSLPFPSKYSHGVTPLGTAGTPKF